MSSSHSKIEEIVNGTESGSVPSQVTLMGASRLGSDNGTGDSFRIDSCKGNEDPLWSSSVANRRKGSSENS